MLLNAGRGHLGGERPHLDQELVDLSSETDLAAGDPTGR